MYTFADVGREEKEGNGLKQANGILEGNIRKQLLILAVPLLIGNIFQQLYNTIDAMVIGKYVGEAAFAAIGIAGTVMNLCIFLLGGCCTGISIILARLFGSDDPAAFRQESYMAFRYGAVFAFLLGGGMILLLPSVLRLIRTPIELYSPITQYLNIIFGGLVVTYFYNLYAASLRAVGDTGVALLFLIVAVLLNTALDILFISVLQLGIRGAAFATVISQCIAAVGCGIYMKKRMPELVYGKEDKKIHKVLLKQTVKYAFISALQQSSLYLGKIAVQGVVNDLGLSSIAAYTAAGRIEGFVNSFGESGADAVSIFAAQNIGAGDVDRAKEGLWKGMKMMILLVLILAAGMYFFAIPLMHLLLGGTVEFIEIGSQYLQGIAFFYFFCFIGSTFVGWYRGSGQVNIPLIGTTLQILIRIVLSMVLCTFIGLKGVAFATGIGWICVVSFQILFYRIKGKHIKIVSNKEN